MCLTWWFGVDVRIRDAVGATLAFVIGYRFFVFGIHGLVFPIAF